MAVEDGGLELESTDLSKFGVVVGSAFGGMDTFEKQTLNLDKGSPKPNAGPNPDTLRRDAQPRQG